MAKRKTSDARKAAPQTPTIHVGTLLREYIVQKGLNQAEIARRSFMTPQTLSGMFRRSSVQLETLIRLSQAMEHDFLADISIRVLGAFSPKSELADPAEPYPIRTPIRFMIEADPGDERALKLMNELLLALNRTSQG